MHFDLLDIIFSKTKRQSAAISDLTFGSVAGFHGDSLTSTDPGNIPFRDSATAWLGELYESRTFEWKHIRMQRC
jgi:hypothetical protein